ncbi:MAG: hypothetical protein ABFD57_02335 [Smithella sp.]
MAKKRFAGFGGHELICSSLSVKIAKMTIKRTAEKKNSPHRKVKRPWCFSRRVAFL